MKRDIFFRIFIMIFQMNELTVIRYIKDKIKLFRSYLTLFTNCFHQQIIDLQVQYSSTLLSKIVRQLLLTIR